MKILLTSRPFRSGAIVSAAAAVLLTTACGPDESGATGTPAATPTQATPTKAAGNGIEAKSADEILEAAVAAFVQASSVRVKGVTTDGGMTISLDLSLGRSEARGTMQAPVRDKSVSFSFIVTNGRTYLKGPELWRAAAGAPMAHLVGDRWVLLPKKGGDIGDLTQIADLEKFAKDVLRNDQNEKIAKGGTAVIDGTPAIGLVGADGTLYVATTGTPYPLKLVPKKPAKPGEELVFLDYDAPLNLTPPADALDLAKLGQ
ncbi:MAG: hypothetical protein ACRDOO_18270 [Actinomadura sp.]